MRHMLAIVITIAFALSATAADAKQCRDAAGKFTKCPEVQKQCRDAQGKFAKCK
jgi:hypothetical protein